MIVRIYDEGQAVLIEAPEGSQVYRPTPALYDLVGGAPLDELLKVPDGAHDFHRLPRPLVIEAARHNLFGLRIVQSEKAKATEDGCGDNPH